jgi:hypothetical protein
MSIPSILNGEIGSIMLMGIPRSLIDFLFKSFLETYNFSEELAI